MNALSHPRDFTPAREAPNSIQEEQDLLGAILVNNDCFHAVSDFLTPADFYEPLHKVVFEIAAKMIGAGKVCNPVSIKPYLPEGQTVGDMPVTHYMARLAAGATTTVNAAEYGRDIYILARRRDMVSLGASISDLAYDAPADMSHWELRESAETRLRMVSEGWKLGGDTSVSLGDAFDEAFQAIGDAYQFKKPAGISTGIEAVDQLTGPWEPGQQIIIGGGTKQGKTSLALQCAMGLASHGPVWVYSGEMSVKQLAMREIARRTGIPVWRQKEGRISKAEFETLGAVRVEVARLPILIEKRRLTLDQIRERGREIKRDRGLAAMVIDHVGLLAWGKDNSRRDEWEQSQIATRELKAIYEELGIPGVSLVQLKKNTFVHSPTGSFHNRMREAINRRPKYTDMMGAVERDADHVIIPFQARPVLAGIEPEKGTDDHGVWELKMEELEHKAEIILALSREKRFPDRREVEWNGETTSFGPAFVGRQELLLPEGF